MSAVIIFWGEGESPTSERVWRRTSTMNRTVQEPLTLALSQGEREQRAGMGEGDEERGLSPRRGPVSARLSSSQASPSGRGQG